MAGGLVLFLTYQPALTLVSIILIVSSTNRKYFFVLLYISQFVFSTIVSFFLNYVVFGVFGVIPGGWRHAHPVRTLQDLIRNIWQFRISLSEFITSYEYQIILLLIVFFYAIKSDKRAISQVLFSFFIIFLFNSTIQIISGVDFPARANIWAWVYFCMVFSKLLKIDEYYISSRKISYIGMLGMLLLISKGAFIWISNCQAHVPYVTYTEYLSQRIMSAGEGRVYACGDQQSVAPLKGVAFRMLRMAMWKTYDINIIPGTSSICTKSAKFSYSDIIKDENRDIIIKFPEGSLDPYAY